MNLIHNHWGKSFEARNREIFLPRLTAGKIIRNQDEQGQLSWGLGSCCLNFWNRLHIHLLASLPRRYPCVHIASARLDWGASDKMDVSWVYPAWHSNEPNVKTSHQLICRCSCRSVLWESHHVTFLSHFQCLAVRKRERERASASFLILILYFLAESCSQGLDPMVNIKPLASERSASDLAGRLETGFIREDLKRFERPMRCGDREGCLGQLRDMGL